MPNTVAYGPCKKCNATNVLFRSRWNAANARYYLQSSCVPCERLATKKHQENNRAYWQKLNSKAYVKKVGRPLKKIHGRSAEEKRMLAAQKAMRRLAYTKQAAFEDELTALVFKEAIRLRNLRNKMTGIEWSVDHIVPFKNPLVSGLHIWSNLQVIPLQDNLKKGTSYAIHTS